MCVCAHVCVCVFKKHTLQPQQKRDMTSVVHQSVFFPQVYRLLEEQVREMQALNELLRQDRHELFTSLNTQRQSEGNSRSVRCLCVCSCSGLSVSSFFLSVLSLYLVLVQGEVAGPLKYLLSVRVSKPSVIRVKIVLFRHGKLLFLAMVLESWAVST